MTSSDSLLLILRRLDECFHGAFDSQVAVTGRAREKSRLGSGGHEPQLVPARSASPIPSTLVAAPAWSAARIAATPTLKQAQMIGPALARPSAERPDSSTRRASSASVSVANSALTASHCGAVSAAPMNKQPVSSPATKDAAR